MAGDVSPQPPPHDLQAEQATLGALLSTSNHQLAAQILDQVRPADFYRPNHQAVADAIATLHAQGVPCDLVSVGDWLLQHGTLAKVGGVPYLHDLVVASPTVVNGPYYAAIVARHARDRALLEATAALGHTIRSELTDQQRTDRVLELARQIEKTITGAGTTSGGRSQVLDWAGLLGADFTHTEWLTEPLLTPGAQISLVGRGKVGKSLFSFEWALKLANGHPYLLGGPGEPARVGYVDLENSHDQIQRRLWAMGYDRLELLGNLLYASFPTFGPLDTPAGAAALVRWATEQQVQVLWLDTISRMISGPENDADTWLSLYRLCLVPLKAAGVAVVRLDHFGKDEGRGSRGSSAKSQDVDAEWTMDQVGDLYRLRRTFTRSGIGRDSLLLRRTGNPTERGTTSHQVVQLPDGRPAAEDNLPPPPPPDSVAQLVQLLDQCQIPENMGRRRVAEELQRHGHEPGRALLLQDAINHRRHRQAAGQQELVDPSPPVDQNDM